MKGERKHLLWVKLTPEQVENTVPMSCMSYQNRRETGQLLLEMRVLHFVS